MGAPRKGWLKTLWSAAKTVAFLGPGIILLALQYARRRDQLEAMEGRASRAEAWQGVGRPRGLEAIPGGVRVYFQEAKPGQGASPYPGHGQGPYLGHGRSPYLEAVFLGEDLLRLTWFPREAVPPYALADSKPPLWEPERLETPEGYLLKTPRLALRLEEEGLSIWDGEGRLLRREAYPERSGRAWRHRVRLASGERVLGLGERAFPLDRRGGVFRFWNRDPGGSYGLGEDPLYLSVPLWLSLLHEGGYLAFYENPADGFADLRGEEALVGFWGGPFRYYLIPGPLEKALARYLGLTGLPPLPPRWALGFHYARWGLRRREEVEEVVEGFLRRGLPLRAVHLDIDYMRGYRVFTVDEGRFPDLGGMVRAFREKGVRTVLILDPGIKAEKGFPPYEEGLREGVFCRLPSGEVFLGPVWPGLAAFPDFTDPRARDWWRDRLRGFLELGVSGFWLDMNEPALFAAWGEPTFPKGVRHSLEGQGGDHLLAHNLYGLLMARASWEGFRTWAPLSRPFLLTRAGYAGVQRFAWAWTADVESTWEGLRTTLWALLGLSLSGVYFVGSDIGGFSGDPSPELYLRWFQMAAFTPFFRLHSARWTKRREPWRLGEEVLAGVRWAMGLREGLLPYLYTLAYEASHQGLPLLRPLFLAGGPYRDPPHGASLGEAFLLGKALLVAPVLEEGARAKEVPLPPGRWYPWQGDGALEGPGWVRLPAPLDRIPLLVRGGSLLPLLQEEGLTLHLYPGEEGAQGLLYWDEGDGAGAYRLDRFRAQRVEGGFRLLWESEGDYPWPWDGIGLKLFGGRLSRVWVQGKAYPAGEGGVRLPPFAEAFLEVAG
ncbi:TIM-barrel domain-containing protein [Thermus altitudinis]|uniref:glycoside hydrolase family 31 protein n=1 Tax=Thermus altitudinis TaxID=2908145 RepID=UPI001FAB1572|nr:TIM-barrel domain-containing protein [Thermus altitudinis]